MTIKTNKEKPQNAKTVSQNFVFHRREEEDEEEWEYKQRGGMTIVFCLELVASKVAGARVLFHAGIAMCRHDEMFNKKLGRKMATERLNNTEQPFFVSGSIPIDGRTLDVEFDKDGFFYLSDFAEEDVDFDVKDLVLESVLSGVDQHLEEFVWPKIHSNPNNPLDDDDEDLDVKTSDDEQGIAPLDDEEFEVGDLSFPPTALPGSEDDEDELDDDDSEDEDDDEEGEDTTDIGIPPGAEEDPPVKH